MDTRGMLCEAIRNRSRLSLRGRDDPGQRVVEPHVVYEAANGNVLVDFYQTGGYSSSGNLPAWRRLVIGDIVSLSTLPGAFSPRTAEGYNPAGKRYFRIICKV